MVAMTSRDPQAIVEKPNDHYIFKLMGTGPISYGIANILSRSIVKKNFRVTLDSKVNYGFVVKLNVTSRKY